MLQSSYWWLFVLEALFEGSAQKMDIIKDHMVIKHTEQKSVGSLNTVV